MLTVQPQRNKTPDGRVSVFIPFVYCLVDAMFIPHYKMQWVTNIATGKKSERDISQEVLLDKPQSAYCLRLYRHPEFYYWYNTDNYCKY